MIQNRQSISDKDVLLSRDHETERTAILSVSQLSIVYGSRTVIAPFDWQVCTGERWALVGVNGSGKSSVIQSILGLNRAAQSQVQLMGSPLSKLSAREQAHVRTYVPQHYDEPFTVTVWQALCSIAPDVSDQQRMAVLHQLGLMPHTQAWLHTLSGGERQRLTWAFAALRAGETHRLMILDEPLSAQDLAWQQRLLQRLIETPSDQAVIAAIHDLNQVQRYATHVLLLGQGRVLAQGTVHEVMQPELLSQAFGVKLTRMEQSLWGV